jgi:hypothetical protein
LEPEIKSKISEKERPEEASWYKPRSKKQKERSEEARYKPRSKKQSLMPSIWYIYLLD